LAFWGSCGQKNLTFSQRGNLSKDIRQNSQKSPGGPKKSGNPHPSARRHLARDGYKYALLPTFEFSAMGKREGAQKTAFRPQVGREALCDRQAHKGFAIDSP
jgi:hypothetical protein